MILEFLYKSFLTEASGALKNQFKKNAVDDFYGVLQKTQAIIKKEVLAYVGNEGNMDELVEKALNHKGFLSEILKTALSKDSDVHQCFVILDKTLNSDPNMDMIRFDFSILTGVWRNASVYMAGELAKNPQRKSICENLLLQIASPFKMSSLKAYLTDLEHECNSVPPIFQKGLSGNDHWMVDVVRVSVRRRDATGKPDIQGLIDLLDREQKTARGRAWVIEGGAGSGKSVLLKILAKKLIERNKNAQTIGDLSFVPVLINHRKPLSNEPWKEALEDMGIVDDGRYGDIFQELAKRQDGLCILVDSFDEIPEGRIDLARKRINVLRNDQLSKATLFVASRPLYKKWEDIRICKVEELNWESKERIVSEWVSDSKAQQKLLNEIREDQKLSELTNTPLMLALVVTADAHKPLKKPGVKVGLLNDYVEALLTEAHRVAPGETQGLGLMRLILGHLAFAWHWKSAGSAREPESFVNKCLETSGYFDDQADPWKAMETYKTHVLRKGFFNPGADGTFKWLHRQIQEFLAADHLNQSTRPDQKLADIQLEHRDTRALWTEVLAFYCALDADDPIARMRKVCKGYADLEIRTLEELDGVSYAKRLKALTDSPTWSVRSIEQMVHQAERRGAGHEIIKWAEQEAVHARTLSQLSFMFHVLQTLNYPWNTDDFFSLIGVPRKGRPSWEFVKIPRVEIVERQKEDSEEVTYTYQLPGFEISKYPVTNHQYATLLKVWASERNLNLEWSRPDRHPVVSLNWYEANFFCSWAELELPTEQQWFAACELGCQHDPPGLFMDQRAWYIANSNMSVHEVGSKEPDALGLYDMTGNVWEWCRDWFNPDTQGLSGEMAPDGDPYKRCYKMACGGCATVEPNFCTSTARTYGPPRDGLDCVGFRPVRFSHKQEAPPNQTLYYQYLKEYSFAVYNDYQATFNKNYAPAYTLLEKAVIKALNHLLAKLENNTLRILDIGCGDGWMHLFLSQQIQKLGGKLDVLYVGVDPNEDALNRIQHNPYIKTETLPMGAEVLDGSMKELGQLAAALGRQQPDFILCTATGHQIRKGSEVVDPKQDGTITVKHLYRKMAEYLKPSGLFLVGDYEYHEKLSRQETEESLFWIRSKTGQDPTAAGGFVAKSSLEEIVDYNYDPYTLTLFDSDEGIANDFIKLNYYTMTWEKEG